jgi:hypothetical protein
MHADRTNRVALTLFGLLVLAVGGAGMAASTGVYGAAYSRQTLLANQASSYTGQHTWIWYAVAAACLLLALACLRWLLALLVSTDRAGDIILPGPADQGTTLIQPAALTDALTTEISGYRGVQTARGRVIGDSRDPEIVLTVTTAPSADLPALRDRIETEALTHARQALSQPSLPIRLDLL